MVRRWENQRLYIQRVKTISALSFWLALSVVISGCLSGPAGPMPNLPGTVSSTQTLLQNSNALVSVSAVGAAIPSDFLGLSVEVSSVCGIIQRDAQNPVYYEQLYRNLGIATLHIGGHTADLSHWSPNGTASCVQSGPVVTRSLIQGLFAFVRRIQWKVTWGLNLIANDPTTAASEAAYVAEVGGKNLAGFTIGNEPELYIRRGERPAHWSTADYYSEWTKIKDAVVAAVPSARFIGPEVCCDSAIFSSFIKESRGNTSLLAISRHFYTRDTSGSAPTITGLLGAPGAVKFASAEAGWVKFAKSYQLPFEITETNSIADGGYPGVSDTFAASLWMSDLLLQSAIAGVQQIDVQNAPNANYNVINDQGKPTILYYALLLAHTATQRAKVVQSALQTALNLTAYTFTDILGTLRVVLINKEPTQPALVTINQGRLYLNATVFRLSGPSLSATTDVTLGDRTLSPQGTWTPPSTLTPLQGTVTQISVPPGSAVCVLFHA